MAGGKRQAASGKRQDAIGRGVDVCLGVGSDPAKQSAEARAPTRTILNSFRIFGAEAADWPAKGCAMVGARRGGAGRRSKETARCAWAAGREARLEIARGLPINLTEGEETLKRLVGAASAPVKAGVGCEGWQRELGVLRVGEGARVGD